MSSKEVAACTTVLSGNLDELLNPGVSLLRRRLEVREALGEGHLRRQREGGWVDLADQDRATLWRRNRETSPATDSLDTKDQLHGITEQGLPVIDRIGVVKTTSDEFPETDGTRAPSGAWNQSVLSASTRTRCR